MESEAPVSPIESQNNLSPESEEYVGNVRQIRDKSSDSNGAENNQNLSNQLIESYLTREPIYKIADVEKSEGNIDEMVPADTNSDDDLLFDNQKRKNGKPNNFRRDSLVKGKNSITNKNRLRILDSDSENEDNNINTDITVRDHKETFPVEGINTITNKNRLRMLDSDSENEEDNAVNTDITVREHKETFPGEGSSSIKRSRLRIVSNDFDSGDEKSENEVGKVEKQTGDEDQKVENNIEDEVHHSLPAKNLISEQAKQQSRLNALCDSESEPSDVETENVKHNEIEEKFVQTLESSKEAKPKKSLDTKPKKMSAKIAADQRRDIQSDSQKRIREKQVSLPYHKPKFRTLKDFMANRSKLASTLSAASRTPPSIAIKMSGEQLELVTLKIKERKKEIELFYKSESESEDEKDATDLEKQTSDINESEMENTSQITTIKDDKTLQSVQDIEMSIPGIQTHSEITDNSIIQLTEPQINGTVNPNNNIKNEEQKLLDGIQSNKEQNFETDGNNSFGNEDISKQISDQEGNLSKMKTSNNEKDLKYLDHSSRSSEIVADETSTLENIADSCNESEMNEDSQQQLCELNHKEYSKIKSNKLIILSNVVLTKPFDSRIEIEEKVNEANLEEKECNELEPELMDYEFDLDDLDDDGGNVGEICKDNEENKEVENSNIECSTNTNLKCSRLESLKEKLANVKPKLSGGPDQMIDLDSGMTKSNEISSLMKRFMQHNMKPNHHKSKMKVSVVSVTDGEIHKETIAMSVDEDEPTAINEKPGAKLQKLRDELQIQMAQRRSELWKEKLNQNNTISTGDTDFVKEDQTDVVEDDLLDDDEEEEMTESELSEEEFDEDDCDVTEKVKKKSVFLDEEAEVSGEEDSDVESLEEDGTYNPDVESEDREVVEDNISSDNSQQSNTSDTVEDKLKESQTVPSPANRVLKRIVKGFTEDSDEEDGNDSSRNNKEPLGVLPAIEHSELSDEDDILPPHQPPNHKTPQRHITQTQQDFLTPVSYITGLQNLNSDSKFSRDSPIISPFQMPQDPSPLKENNRQSSLQKKLFYEPPCSSQSQINEDDLADICSGVFPPTIESQAGDNREPCESASQQATTVNLENTNYNDSQEVCTQDLADICSGAFTGISDSVEKSTAIKKNEQTKNALNESEEQIISQLIDEEELEQFKKKFYSSADDNSQKIQLDDAVSETQAAGGVIDSDDDDGVELHVKRRKTMKLSFSDDESSISEPPDLGDPIDLHDEESSHNVNYDSEENEIEDATTKVPMKASDFFENEAELSESEWGSEDEDERDLDDLEFEKGDQEVFDENKMRSDIEKLQMRQMLDEDNKEVKLLQELLLEDGELHGSGRERQFRWKNIDSPGNEVDDSKEDDGEVYIDEEESEEQWRKMRHEREMFLINKQSQSQEDNESIRIESQTLKFAHKTIIRNKSTICETSSVKDGASPVAKLPLALFNKRGSFLGRSEQVLQRLGESIKISSGAKSSKKIVFHTVEQEQVKKRKAADSTPLNLKKLRLSELSPAVPKKQKSDRAKQLFGML